TKNEFFSIFLFRYLLDNLPLDFSTLPTRFFMVLSYDSGGPGIILRFYHVFPGSQKHDRSIRYGLSGMTGPPGITLLRALTRARIGTP
ncbi:MAG TPA: hypothetical protein PK297_13795, partial [Spirochaetota bacterium]|nr:hypothetical protein [Spirochaetota bacterium]